MRKSSLAGFCAILSAMVVHDCLHASALTTLLADRASYSSAVVPGKWHSNWTKVKAYAEANNVPMIAVWSEGETCKYCERLESAMNLTDFKTWMSNSKCVFCFVCISDADGKENGDFYTWTRPTGSAYNGYPFIKAYWSKDGTEKVNISASGRSIMGEVANTSINEPKIKAWLEKQLSDFYTPANEGGYDDKKYIGWYFITTNRTEIYTLERTRTQTNMMIPLVRNSSLSGVNVSRLAVKQPPKSYGFPVSALGYNIWKLNAESGVRKMTWHMRIPTNTWQLGHVSTFLMLDGSNIVSKLQIKDVEDRDRTTDNPFYMNTGYDFDITTSGLMTEDSHFTDFW